MIFTRFIARALFIPALVVAAAVLVKGYQTAGDGFSAGVIASLGFLLQYLAFGYETVERLLHAQYIPGLAIAGLLLALSVAFGPTVAGYAVLTHFPQPGMEVFHLGSFELHTALLYDLGVFFLVVGFTVSITRLIAQIAQQGLG